MSDDTEESMDVDFQPCPVVTSTFAGKTLDISNSSFSPTVPSCLSATNTTTAVFPNVTVSSAQTISGPCTITHCSTTTTNTTNSTIMDPAVNNVTSSVNIPTSILLLEQQKQQTLLQSSIERAISNTINKDRLQDISSGVATLSEYTSKLLPLPLNLPTAAATPSDLPLKRPSIYDYEFPSQPSHSSVAILSSVMSSLSAVMSSSSAPMSLSTVIPSSSPAVMSSSSGVTSLSSGVMSSSSGVMSSLSGVLSSTSLPETTTASLTYVTSSSKTVLSSSLIHRAESIDSGDSTDSDNDDESSELDEEECERRKDECLKDMAELEIQFSDMKEQLYSERTKQVQTKLEEIRQETAQEYLNPLADLRRNMEIRLEVADVLRDFKREAIRNRYDCEMQMANQSYENEKFLQMESMREDLGEKIKRLEEDRNSIDVYTDLWNDAHSAKKQKKRSGDFYPDKKRKPVTVSGPYIVYMLRDFEILEDWTTIRKARNATMRKKFECE